MSTQKLLSSFNFTHWPEIHYGAGVVQNIASSLPLDDQKILWVTGGRSGIFSGYFQAFLRISGIKIADDQIVQIGGEPTPAMIDDLSAIYRSRGICKIVAIGGGSVIDAAKAISAMLPLETSLLDHLEGVGKGLALTGSKIPLIAIPTTSGTGSEMTANAVFSEIGEQGYKKSIRHKSLIPDEIWIDPCLMISCPPQLTACSGLDTFTQLLESYLSTKSNIISDALAEKGLRLVIDNLEKAFDQGSQDTDVRGSMAIASLLSGTCLANAGLGIVHGLAGPLGGFFDIPHGVACAGLVAKANQVNHRALKERSTSIANGDVDYLKKMADVGRMFGAGHKSDDYYCEQLTQQLFEWESRFDIPKFSNYGISQAALAKLVNASSNRNNPIELSSQEIESILQHCL
ncbi:MAG: iron-containing alcohol dehydrogenase [Osedax symbiont Rs2]|nr:MAG: iron-containing alcohol dehydrogenase [Osedax symbiont Rs2]